MEPSPDDYLEVQLPGLGPVGLCSGAVVQAEVWRGPVRRRGGRVLSWRKDPPRSWRRRLLGSTRDRTDRSMVCLILRCYPVRREVILLGADGRDFGPCPVQAIVDAGGELMRRASAAIRLGAEVEALTRRRPGSCEEGESSGSGSPPWPPLF